MSGRHEQPRVSWRSPRPGCRRPMAAGSPRRCGTRAASVRLLPALPLPALLLLWPAPAPAQKVFLNCSDQVGNPVTGGGNEAQYALDNANRTRDILVRHGFDIIVDQNFRNSPAHANNWGAENFLSIHSNAGGGHGVETLYKSERGRVLSSSIQAGMLSSYNFGDRGLKLRNDLHMLNATNMPACLPEVLFHDCARDHGGTTESAFLRSADGRARIARGLADGVCRHYNRPCEDGPPPPQYAATFVGKEHPARLLAGDEVVVWVEYRNDGTATWSLARTFLGTTEPRDRASPFFVPENWAAPNRPTNPDHSNYGTGAVGRFTFLIRAPEVQQSTRFVEHWGLVQEGVTWFGPPDGAVFFDITVEPRQPPPPVDEDGDGHAAAASGGDDCDDGDPAVHPGAADPCADGRDQDCDGVDPPCPPLPDEDAGPAREDAGSTPDGGGSADGGGWPVDVGWPPDAGESAPGDVGSSPAEAGSGELHGRPGAQAGDEREVACHAAASGRSGQGWPLLVLLAVLLRRRPPPAREH
ncbi:MAG: hypothetical protein FJ125_08545 [Deltaproteobacteria bacterium]|nr:hypothetical protein [Deltaproteobacteria bacterium]